MHLLFVATNLVARSRFVLTLPIMIAWMSLTFVGVVLGQSDEPPRLPVPKTEALRAAEKQIREIFQTEFAAAKKPAEKADLAGKLWNHTVNTDEDATARYALLDAARVLATEADANKFAFNVIESLATQYEVNGSELKMAVLVANSKGMRDAAEQVEFCELIQKAIESAAREEQFEVTSKLVPLLLVSAGKLKDAAQRKPFQTRHAELKLLQPQWAAVAKAKVTLAKSPEDEAANTNYGRYLCLTAGDWDKGLPLLARGTATKLTAVARQDVEQRTTPDEQLALADAWWNLAQSESGIEKQQLLLRANDWYTAVAPELKGLLRTKTHQRMESIKKQYPEAVELQARVRSLRDGTLVLKGFGLSSGMSKSKGKPAAPFTGELDREMVPKLLNARVQVGIKTVGQDKMTFVSRATVLPETPFAITLVSMNSKFVGHDTIVTEDFLKIAQLARLESLHSHGVEFPAEFWKEFPSAETLTQLSLVNAGASDATVATLPKLPHLRTLDLSDSTVSDVALERMATFPSLEFLGISRTRVTAGGIEFLETSQLTQLRAENLNLKDWDLAVFAKLEHLSELSLADELLTGEGFRSFSESLPLKRLNLRSVRLSVAGATRIGEIASLQSLTFQEVALDEAKLKALCAESRVESLGINDSTLPEAALRHLTASLDLKSLNLDGTKVTGAGFKGMMPLRTVTQISLNKTSLDDAGLVHVARAFPNATSLFLNETDPTDAGLKPLRSLTDLNSLALGRTRVTVKGLTSLESLASLDTLVVPAKVSPTEVRAALPQCRNVSGYSK